MHPSREVEHLRLVIENISKQYKDKIAVNQFFAELSGGVYALLGPNGSGKTTLMRMLAGILKPTSGRVLLNGQDIAVMDEDYRDVLGYLPQEFGMYHNFIDERFLMYFSSFKVLYNKKSIKKINEIVVYVNLK